MSENNNRIISYSRIVFENFKQSTQLYFKRLVFNFDRRLGFPFSKNPNAYENLTPKIIEDNTYIDAINWALQNKDINNIALTGAYGSGKSSVLKTLKESYKQYNYVNISLATFEDLVKSAELNKRIELSILQQLLYLEKSKNIPNSRFKKIKNFKNYNLILNTLIWFFVGLSFIFIFQRDYLHKISVFKNINKYFSIIEIFALIILTAGALFILRNFLKSISNFKFDKITSKGDFELNREDKETSILNKNLDEIIYFFEKTKYNVVIIEDLDRFKEPEIFTKLREINLLLNNSKQVNRHITFIYALTDSMFKDGNRTKFFDFFVPIIPVINSSNSYEKLKDRLDFENISDSLLYDVSLYIEDMRLLINIVNEYKIYKEKLLGKINLNENKLFAFIVYKNKFPEDFAELSDNRGFIYAVFNSDIPNVKKTIIEKINTKISKSEQKIIEIKNIKLQNVLDLRKIYILQIIKNLPNEKDLKLNLSEDFTIKEIDKLISDEVFDELNSSDDITYSYSLYNRNYGRYDSTSSSISYEEIENQIDENQTYQKKEYLIKERDSDAINNYNEEITKFKVEINRVKSLSLEELLDFSPPTNGLNDEVKKHNILIYLLRNGFITEDYFDYISIFYEGSITKNDKNFILSIRDKNPLDLTFKLDKIEGIIKHIKNDLRKPEVLNIHLLDYLFEIQNTELYQQIFNQYTNINSRLVDFAVEYINSGKYDEMFYKMICFYWKDFWKFIQENGSYTQESKDNILVKIIANVDNTDLRTQNKGNIITEYISNKTDFLTHFNDDDNILKEVLPLLNVKFKNTIDYNTNKNLFQFVYEKNLYELNIQLITQFLKEIKFISPSDLQKLKSENLTTINAYDCESMLKYIEADDNINDYVKNVFLTLEENTEECEVIVLKLLNNEKLENENKIAIIEKENVKLTTLSDVTDNSLWIDLFENNKLQPTWQNIYTFYLKYGLEENVNSYLNNFENIEVLAKSKIFSSITAEDIDKHKFIRDLILNDEITDKTYTYLCKSLKHTYNKLEINKIDEFKINKLIEDKIIKLSVENFDLLKENSENGKILLIELNFKDYLTEKENFEFEIEDYEKLLKSTKLTEENKIDLISEITEDNITDENNLPKIIAELLVKFKKIKIEYTLLYKLLENITRIEHKLILFNKYFDLFSGEVREIDELIRLVGNPYLDITLKWKEIQIDKVQVNFDFLNNLSSVNYPNISSVNDKGKKLKIYTKRK